MYIFHTSAVQTKRVFLVIIIIINNINGYPGFNVSTSSFTGIEAFLGSTGSISRNSCASGGSRIFLRDGFFDDFLLSVVVLKKRGRKWLYGM